MYDQTAYLKRVNDAQTKIGQMTEEQIEQKLKFAKEQSDVIDLPLEDRTLLIEICRTDARKTISTMSIDEVNRMIEELWEKFEKYHTGESEDELSTYEFYYLSELKRRQSQDKRITVAKATKNALKETSTEKCAEADHTEKSQSNQEKIEEGVSKDD